MIKHAASLNFFQALKDRQKDRRNQELAPAWWANILSEIPGLGASQVLAANMYKPIDYTHYTRNMGEVNDIIRQSGLDLHTVQPSAHIPIFPTMQNYAYSNHKPGDRFTKLEQVLSHVPEKPEDDFGQHGAVLKMLGRDKERWHIPSLAHEIGHAQEEHLMGPLAKGIQHSRGLGALTNIGAGIESFRALDNNPRSIDERKQMLNRSSLLSATAWSPTLINEFRASRNGIDFLNKIPLENKAEILDEAKRMLPKAFGTYALLGAGSVLAPQIAKLFLPKHAS